MDSVNYEDLWNILCFGAGDGLVRLPEHPNIVFILTDDQGYGDWGCTGNPDIHTPNIDRLDATGVSFTDFHSATSSAPTRSGIMTGGSLFVADRFCLCFRQNLSGLLC